MFKEKNRGIAEVHIAVLLFGLAGLFGKLIDQHSLVIVFGRVFFATIFLSTIVLVKKQSIKLESKKDFISFVVLGFLLAFHWVSFFLSIQLSTVAIGLLMFSTFPIFVTFIEPFFFNQKIKFKDIVIAGITFIGVILVVPNFQFESTMTKGALWGIIAGFSFAILSILNKKLVGKYDSVQISLYENGFATAALLPFMLFLKPNLDTRSIGLMIVLGVVFTGISHTLFINSLKKIKAQTASIIACLEPVYGIIASVILLAEYPSTREVLGGAVILMAASYSTLKGTEVATQEQ